MTVNGIGLIKLGQNNEQSIIKSYNLMEGIK